MSTHDYEVRQIKVRDLDSTCVLVGESGGLSAVYNCGTSSVMAGCCVVETEHGSLYMDSDELVEVLNG